MMHPSGGLTKNQQFDGEKNRLTNPLYIAYLMYLKCINSYLMKFPLVSAILVLWGWTNRQTDKASYRDAWMLEEKKNYDYQ